MIDWDAPPAEDMRVLGSLTDDYVVPPFSVLDTRQGYWQARRRRWLSLGIQSELGRSARTFSEDLMRGEVERDYGGMRSGLGRELQPGSGNYRSDYGVYDAGSGNVGQGDGLRRGALATSPQMVAAKPSADRTTYLAAHRGADQGDGGQDVPAPGTSIFDPVLCELAYRWWSPAGGTILDPFAGGSVRGIVAAKLGHPYIGIDLSARQLAANREQARALLGPDDPMPTWIEGDSVDLDLLIGSTVKADLVFSCPPYYDLEVYSDNPADLSAKGSYAEFIEAYRAIVRAAVGHLKPGGFAAMVVSEVRGEDGFYRGLVPDTVAALNDAGAGYYNEAILVNSAGSLPLRAGAYMRASRKLGRCHQNVIVGRKGSTKTNGWSTERQAPPEPQMPLWDEEE